MQITFYAEENKILRGQEGARLISLVLLWELENTETL